MPGDGNNGLIVLPCLSMLSEAFLVDASLEGARSIHLSAPCQSCRISAGESFITGSVKRALLLLSALGRDTSIRFELSESRPAETEAAVPIGEKFSRRDFIGGLSKAIAREALAANDELKPPDVPAGYLKPVDLPLKRRRLNDIVKPLVSSGYKFTEKDSPFRVVSVNENCTACMACSVSCPTGALSRREAAGTVQIMFSAVKCVKCYECAGICPEQAISYSDSFIVDRAFTGSMLLYEKRQRMCVSCDRPFMPEGDETQCRACVKFKKFRRSLLGAYGRR
jgi:ferredoxin